MLMRAHADPAPAAIHAQTDVWNEDEERARRPAATSRYGAMLRNRW